MLKGITCNGETHGNRCNETIGWYDDATFKLIKPEIPDTVIIEKAGIKCSKCGKITRFVKEQVRRYAQKA